MKNVNKIVVKKNAIMVIKRTELLSLLQVVFQFQRLLAMTMHQITLLIMIMLRSLT